MECIYPKQCLDTLESKLLTGLSLTNDLLTLEKLNVLKSENHSLNNQRKCYVKTAIILQAKCFPVSVNNKLTWKLNIKYQTKGLNCNTVLIWRLLMPKITKHFILLTCCSTYDCIELWGNKPNINSIFYSQNIKLNMSDNKENLLRVNKSIIYWIKLTEIQT